MNSESELKQTAPPNSIRFGQIGLILSLVSIAACGVASFLEIFGFASRFLDVLATARIFWAGGMLLAIAAMVLGLESSRSQAAAIVLGMGSSKSRAGVAAIVLGSAMLIPSILIIWTAGPDSWWWDGTEEDEFVNEPIQEAIPESALTSRAFPISAVLDTKIADGESAIFCGAFQLAWNELSDNLVRSPIELVGNPDLVDKLNVRKFSKQDMSPENYFVDSGFQTANELARLEDGFLQRFPGGKDQLPELSEDRLRAFAFAYFEKSLEFETNFEDISRGLKFESGGKTVTARAFGISSLDEGSSIHKKLKNQVHVFDYKNNSDFIVELKTKARNDHLILAKVPAKPSLAALVEEVQKRISASRPVLMHYDDTLRIPVVQFQVNHSYTELTGKPLVDQSSGLISILDASQSVQFRLDKRGAFAVGSAHMDVAANGHVPMTLMFDGPFLLMMREKGSASPYLVLWIGSSAFLDLSEPDPTD